MVKRSDVFALAAKPDVNEATVCAAAMAWGGMHLGNWSTLMKLHDHARLEVAQEIRQECLDRAKAYERLKCLKKQGELKGMGPAFFTKLIYFLTPCDNSEHKTPYIMDRWSGCSVNLLTGSELVLFDVTKTRAAGTAWCRPTTPLKPTSKPTLPAPASPRTSAGRCSVPARPGATTRCYLSR